MKPAFIFAAIIAFTAFVIFVFQQGEKDRMDQIQTRGLSNAQTLFMDSCISSMRDYDLEFSSGASALDGCSCVADKLSPATVQDEMAYYRSAHDTLVYMMDIRSGESGSDRVMDTAQAAALRDAVRVCGIKTGTRAQAQKERQDELCANRTEAEHTKIEKLLAEKGQGYNRDTCSVVRQ